MSVVCVVSDDDASLDYDVDIIAIHGLYEDQINTWTHPETRTFWLRDLLSPRLPKARILTYGYKLNVLSSIEEGSPDRLFPHALNLIANIHADRVIANAVERPIIFVCHGLGGILVKKALVFSNTSKSKQVEHRRSIFISTYAILFLGTPHYGIGSGALSSTPNQFLAVLAKGSELLQDINDQFAPLTKRFSIYCFWEQVESECDGRRGYVVEEDSAAPGWEPFERSGIFADHSRMCKFASIKDDGFKVVLAALIRYTEEAPKIIRIRWREDKALIAKERQGEAKELLRHDSDLLNSDGPPAVENEHFIVPHSASSMFTGRSEIARILRQKIVSTPVRDGHQQHKIFVLYGLGGSGKTQFCLKFVEDNRHCFWGIFWIDASSDQNAEADFAFLGTVGKKGTTFAAGKHWLSNCRKPWLLVIDNADDPEMDISKYFPSGGRGHILITTRNPSNVVHSTIGDVHFREMDEEDAITLLLKAAYQPGAEGYMDLKRREIARPITDTLGRLALALTHAGATIRRNMCTLEDYLPEYCVHRREMMRQNSLRRADQYKLTIITTWEVPYGRIKQRNTRATVDAIEILHIFAFLHFEQIPDVMFQKAWNNLQCTSISTASGLLGGLWSIASQANQQPIPRILRQAGPTWDKPRFGMALATLSEHSLVYHDPAKGMCSMHPVVHAWARDRLQAEEQRYWLRAAATILANSITSELEASGRKFRRLLVPHIDSCMQGKNVELLDYTKNQFQASNAVKFASLYAENGRWKAARTIQRNMVKLRTKTLGSDHPETLQMMSNLAWTYWNLGNINDALQIQLNIQRTREKTLGPIHPMTLKAMDDLARTYWLLGDRERSKVFGLKAVEGLKNSLGPADPATLMSMANLGRTYLHLGLPDRAEELLVQVLETRKRFFGIKHDDTLMAMADLAMSYLALKRLPEAESLATDTLRERTDILGEEHAYTLWAVNDLSKIYCAQARASKAVEMLEGIVPIVERTLGEGHVGMSMTKFNLACAYISQRHFRKAEVILMNQLENLSPKHPDWMISMLELGRTCKLQGHLEEAEKLFLEAIEAVIKTQALGLHHPRTRSIIQELTGIYEQQNRRDEIEKLESRMESSLKL